MNLNLYVETVLRELEEQASGRHSCQRATYTKILLDAFLAENEHLKNINVVDQDKLKDIIWNEAENLRVEFGYKWDEARAKVVSTQIYKDFSLAVNESNVLANKVTLYKSKNGELACKFPSEKSLQRFVSAIGGEKVFPESNQYFAGKISPMTFKNNPTTLYIHGYTARNGELAAVFPSSVMRDEFYKHLDLGKGKCASVYEGQEALYINDKSINQPRSHLSIDVPACCTNSGYNALIKGEAHLFFKQNQPKAIVNLIGSGATASLF